MYDEVVRILREDYGWPIDCAPAPKATAKALETQSPSAVAAYLDNWCWSQAQRSAPWGYELGSVGAYQHVRYKNFADHMKFWEYQSALAFGFTHELPEDKLPEATTLTEWYALLRMGRNALGYKIDDPNSESWQRRLSLSRNPPEEWVDIERERIWELGVLHGSIETDLAPFQTSRRVEPTLEHARVLDGTKFLKNVLALAHGAPALPYPPPEEA